jgi:hypothetical protein
MTRFHRGDDVKKPSIKKNYRMLSLKNQPVEYHDIATTPGRVI